MFLNKYRHHNSSLITNLIWLNVTFSLRKHVWKAVSSWIFFISVFSERDLFWIAFVVEVTLPNYYMCVVNLMMYHWRCSLEGFLIAFCSGVQHFCLNGAVKIPNISWETIRNDKLFFMPFPPNHSTACCSYFDRNKTMQYVPRFEILQFRSISPKNQSLCRNWPVANLNLPSNNLTLNWSKRAVSKLPPWHAETFSS